LYSKDERRELIKEFVAEGRELLDDIEPQIIALEKEVAASGRIDQDSLNAIFRLFHSLKGAASFFDLQNIIGVTHEAETLLDLFRKGKAVVASEHVDLLCRTTDVVRGALEKVEQEFTDKDFEETAQSIVNDLKRVIESISVQQAPAEAGEPAPPGRTAPAGETKGFHGSGCRTGDEELNSVVTPETVRCFTEEAMALCDEAEAALLSLEKEPGNLEHAGQAFRALHSLKGNAGFMGYGELEEISHHAKTVLDAIRGGQKDADSVVISFLLIAVDSLRDGIRQVSNGVTVDIAGKEELVRRLDLLGGEAVDDSGQVTDEEFCAAKESAEFGQDRGDDAATGKPDGGRYDEQAGKESVSAQQKVQQADMRKKQASFSGRQQVIRIDLNKLDALLDLVGELVIAEAMVAHNPDLAGLQLERFEKAVLQLDKITRDIQEVAMSMRMIPLAGTFRKMVRLVRDLAHKAGKKVDLQITGEETEVDKTIIEQISDPLVHLVRNAVDHGIETPEERLAGGKPETGKITIEAKHSVGEVWIIVADDGRGLDREKILRKAVEKGLLSEDRELKDEEAWRLIFEPGFSTADQVSSVSGRGVGMDVVKRNIEKLRGKVDVQSRLGFGTVFTIRIPLTLAIIEGMVVRVGHNRYSIPISSIKKSIQPRADEITRTPDGMEVVRVCEELLPVIRLHELYRVEPDYEHLTEGILIIVENGEQKYCLFVDELVGQQQIVIKGLSTYLGHVKGVSGCAILGDGDISLILDVADLFGSAQSMLGQVH